MGMPPHDTSETTIVAVATPPGRGGVGIVRLSGAEALRVAHTLGGPRSPQPRVAVYRVLRDSAGQRVDDALITFFQAPQSYTGEDVVEIATHGSPVVLDWLVRACVQHGAVPARPGEFTERAFLNGRLDLTGAEAVRDLIEAQTLEQARLAAEQMGGSIAAAVAPVKQALLELIAGLEAGIDFAEDDIETVPRDELLRRIRQLLQPTSDLLATFTHGRLLRDGLRLAIVGAPNAGKSSLFNRLVQKERAIVTAVPGTTRDVIAERVALDGIPVELLDTAGLRDTADEAERMGVERSRQAIAEADVVLVVVDATAPAVAPDGAYTPLQGRPVVLVRNKVDLLAQSPSQATATPGVAEETQHTGRSQLAGMSPLEAGWPAVHTSAVTGQGIQELRAAVVALVSGGVQRGRTATLTNLRQQQAVEEARRALQRAEDGVTAAVPHEMILLDLYEALHAQNALTGEITADDVLHLIFSSFCIGK